MRWEAGKSYQRRVVDASLVRYPMMDPVAALGLAANIVAFIDFSWKLLYEIKDLHDSSTGTLLENDTLERISNDLMSLNDDLTAPSAINAIPAPVRSLASQCKDVTIKLLDVLDDLKVRGSHRKWKSFVQALRSVWKKEEIEGLMKRLERLRSEMLFRLQVLLK